MQTQRIGYFPKYETGVEKGCYLNINTVIAWREAKPAARLSSLVFLYILLVVGKSYLILHQKRTILHTPHKYKHTHRLRLHVAPIPIASIFIQYTMALRSDDQCERAYYPYPYQKYKRSSWIFNAKDIRYHHKM